MARADNKLYDHMVTRGFTAQGGSSQGYEHPILFPEFPLPIPTHLCPSPCPYFLVNTLTSNLSPSPYPFLPFFVSPPVPISRWIPPLPISPFPLPPSPFTFLPLSLFPYGYPHFSSLPFPFLPFFVPPFSLFPCENPHFPSLPLPLLHISPFPLGV